MTLARTVPSILFILLLISAFPSAAIAEEATKLQITSPAIPEGATIPTQFTCSGANQAPLLKWSEVPSNTKSLALIVEDPDAPAGTFVHWIVYDISPSSSGLATSVVEGQQGVNSAGKAAYMGPCPPPGNPHHYHFELFALDTMLHLEAHPNAPALRSAMQGHIIQSAELVGIFGR